MGYYKHNNWDNITMPELMYYYTYALNETHKDYLKQASLWSNEIQIEDIWEQSG